MEPGVAFYARRKFEQEKIQRNDSDVEAGSQKSSKVKKRDPYKITKVGGTDDGEEDEEFDNLASISVFPVGPTRCNCVIIIDNEKRRKFHGLPLFFFS